MSRARLRALLLFLLTSASLPLIAQAPPAATGEAARWWADVAALAGDDMQGRLTGSPEYLKAAGYVAHALEQAGLAPAGTDGYFQPVGFVSRTLVPERSTLTLVADGRETPLPIGEEAIVGLRYDPASSVDAPLVFAGYGLSVPDAGYDDLEELDVRGKVVVYLTGAPDGLPGEIVAHAQSAAQRWSALARAGAVGTIAINPAASHDVPWERAALRALAPTMRLEDPELDDTKGQQIGLTVNEAGAARLLAGSGHEISELVSLARSGRRLPRFPLTPRLRTHLELITAPLRAPNVVALLRGSDPRLASEHVVLSAHLDHVGVGDPIDGDRIYNGAMDNASGIATLLEAARRLAGSSPRRSIVFLAVTAEEQGLLGSRYWVAHPTVPRDSIVADVNVDMFLPLYPMKSVLGLGAGESDLGDDLERVATRAGLRVVPDPEPRRRRFTRSDQYSFIRAGIPALALKLGYEVGTPEQDLVRQFTERRYHAPSDDLQQPIDLEAAVAFNRLYVDLATRIANRDTRPAWKADSFFRRFATD